MDSHGLQLLITGKYGINFVLYLTETLNTIEVGALISNQQCEPKLKGKK